jgi:hypothetical protein
VKFQPNRDIYSSTWEVLFVFSVSPTIETLFKHVRTVNIGVSKNLSCTELAPFVKRLYDEFKSQCADLRRKIDSYSDIGRWVCTFCNDASLIGPQKLILTEDFSLSFLDNEVINSTTVLESFLDDEVVIKTSSNKYSLLKILEHFVGGKDGKSEFFDYYAIQKRKEFGHETEVVVNEIFSQAIAGAVRLLEEIPRKETLKVRDVAHVRKLNSQLKKSFTKEVQLLTDFFQLKGDLDMLSTITIATHAISFGEKQTYIAEFFHNCFPKHDAKYAEPISKIRVPLETLTVKDAELILKKEIYPLLGEAMFATEVDFFEVLTKKKALVNYLYEKHATYEKESSLLNSKRLERENVCNFLGFDVNFVVLF